MTDGNNRRGPWSKTHNPRKCSVSGCTKPHKAKGMCRMHYLRSWRDPIRESQNEKFRKRLESDPDFKNKRNAGQRERRRVWHYGLTTEQKQSRVAAQLDRCPICRTTDPGKIGWCSDHSHENFQLRGELCSRCNARLGLCDEHPEIMSERELAYVNYYKNLAESEKTSGHNFPRSTSR